MCRGRGDKIMMGTVVKTKVGELEDEAREIFTRRTRKELNGVAEAVSGNKRCLARFQYELKKDLILNQLTAVIVERIPNTKEAKVTTIFTITDE